MCKAFNSNCKNGLNIPKEAILMSENWSQLNENANYFCFGV